MYITKLLQCKLLILIKLKFKEFSKFLLSLLFVEIYFFLFKSIYIQILILSNRISVLLLISNGFSYKCSTANNEISLRSIS